MATDKTSELDDHRKMLTLSKQLSDFQITNLKAWPQIAFNDVKNSTVDYSFIDKDEMFYAGKVIFRIALLEEPNKEEIIKRSNHLADWTRILFWTDTQVEVFVNEQRINSSL